MTKKLSPYVLVKYLEMWQSYKLSWAWRNVMKSLFQAVKRRWTYCTILWRRRRSHPRKFCPTGGFYLLCQCFCTELGLTLYSLNNPFRQRCAASPVERMVAIAYVDPDRSMACGSKKTKIASVCVCVCVCVYVCVFMCLCMWDGCVHMKNKCSSPIRPGEVWAPLTFNTSTYLYTMVWWISKAVRNS
jgi:hypothetical protein